MIIFFQISYLLKAIQKFLNAEKTQYLNKSKLNLINIFLNVTNEIISKNKNKKVELITTELSGITAIKSNLYKQLIKVLILENLKKESRFNCFLTQFLQTLNCFLNNQKAIINLKLVNKDINYKLTQSNHKLFKKIIMLRKYQKTNFFKEGTNILFLAITKKNSEELLASYIANELQNQKRHNFFLSFVKRVLTLFCKTNWSLINSIKILVKGRFNGAPRARKRIYKIGKGLPLATFNSKIGYAEKVAFTKNGTFGVKIWICKK